MNVGLEQQEPRSWTTRRDEKRRRLQLVSTLMNGPLLPREELWSLWKRSLRRVIGSCSKVQPQAG
jgi:hypothetical protein